MTRKRSQVPIKVGPISTRQLNNHEGGYTTNYYAVGSERYEEHDHLHILGGCKQVKNGSQRSKENKRPSKSAIHKT